MEKAIEQEIFGSLNREFDEVPLPGDPIPQPTAPQLAKAADLKHKLNSATYTF